MHPPLNVNVNVSLDRNDIHISTEGDGRFSPYRPREPIWRAPRRAIRAICQGARAHGMNRGRVADRHEDLPIAFPARGVLSDAERTADRDGDRGAGSVMRNGSQGATRERKGARALRPAGRTRSDLQGRGPRWRAAKSTVRGAARNCTTH